ncbi:hypothetical protein [Mycobacterium sp. E3247]|uniref:hypothetical protein n=1 Tax=Mycobacterium sp. E3247 TaxID=1856864 RepID=UPI00080208A8|nr:hypothetical protein [Mycobacterium sp. E3247]OBG99772.1 hypothetical protein A9X04_29220 [Mycobacterium sp. E3247]
MKPHLRSLGLLAGAVAAMALNGGTGVAQADSGDGAAGIINQLITSTPALASDQADQHGPSTGSDAVGMYCENRFARCR